MSLLGLCFPLWHRWELPFALDEDEETWCCVWVPRSALGRFSWLGCAHSYLLKEWIGFCAGQIPHWFPHSRLRVVGIAPTLASCLTLQPLRLAASPGLIFPKHSPHDVTVAVAPCSGWRAGAEDAELGEVQDGTEQPPNVAEYQLCSADWCGPEWMGHLPIRDLIENNTVQFNTVIS